MCVCGISGSEATGWVAPLVPSMMIRLTAANRNWFDLASNCSRGVNKLNLNGHNSFAPPQEKMVNQGRTSCCIASEGQITSRKGCDMVVDTSKQHALNLQQKTSYKTLAQYVFSIIN
jgi:hypothetical protein